MLTRRPPRIRRIDYGSALIGLLIRVICGYLAHGSEDEWIDLALFAIVTFPRVALRQIRTTVTVVKAIDGAAVVAM